MKPKPKSPIYGVVAEFDGADALLTATKKTVAEGYRSVEAYSPFPVEGLDEALGFQRSRVPLITLIGGIVGCLGGFFMQWYSSVEHYPINVGGRPLNSWPAFIPITFETTILLASLTAVVGMIALNGLPQPYHPVFNVPRFGLASTNRFFLCIEAHDPKFSLEPTRAFLEGLGPQEVSEVAL